MGYHSPAYKKIVPGKKYFGHDIAVVTVILQIVFGAKIVKTIRFRCIVAKEAAAIFMDNRITIPDKFKTHITAGFNDKPFFRFLEISKNSH